MTGWAEFVVHEPFEEIKQVLSSSSFTPIKTVFPFSPSSSFAGAEIRTLLAPAVKCTLAFSYDSNTPVDSTTRSIPSSPQGRLAGSFSDKKITGLPSIEK